MSLSRSISRSVGRSISRQIISRDRRRTNYRRLQNEAAARPESRRVQTPAGVFWMSPIEFELYEAMRREGLSPIPQFCIKGFFVDFAFPDVDVAIEADGAAYHSGERRDRDRKRDSIIRRAGWTVKRFQGTTIHNKSANCANIIKKEVVTRRMRAKERTRQEEIGRQERRAALLRPFRRITQLLKRNK